MKVGILTNNDGSIAVISPVQGTPEDQLDAVFAQANPDNLPLAVIDHTDLPKDRTFREAWTFDGKCAIIDKNKADTIQMDRLRVIRNEKLASLDVDMIRAMETNDTKNIQEIKDLKQQLRDIPQTEDLSKISIDELPDYKPDYL